MNYYIYCLKHYFDFKGHASRAEFWWFQLFNAIITFIIVLIGQMLGLEGILDLIYNLIIIIPMISLATRRLHDINKSGWWQLVSLIPLIGSIILLICFCFKGDSGDNRFGVDPLSEAQGSDKNKF